MISFILFVVFSYFVIWDCVFFAMHHELVQPTGWKSWVLALIPGTGWYYKFLATKKEKEIL